MNRALVEGLLAGRPYPASREELVRYARSEGFAAEVVAALDRLPEGEYATPNEVGEELFPVEPRLPEQARATPAPQSGEDYTA